MEHTGWSAAYCCDQRFERIHIDVGNADKLYFNIKGALNIYKYMARLLNCAALSQKKKNQEKEYQRKIKWI